ncbi:MAG TPA: response regulator [Burkholderiales bacterium]|nr:response regulator [Burkholderiales bacterium]
MAARILIIEDNEANLELMSYLLRAFGHSIVGARDGAQGLEMARSGQADLVLCDIQLPVIGGREIASRLRSDATFERLPLVAVTALAMVGDRETMLAAGFDGYIAKPIAPEAFVQQVEAFLPAALRGSLPPTMTHAQSAVGAPSAHKAATILVVDDKPENLELARSLFRPSGYRVLTATGLRPALAVARDAWPDLIISDICMPDASGWDFIKAVKADAQLSAIPFVFLTSTVTTESDRKKGLALGAMKFIFRPIEAQRLLQEIEACLPGPRKG